jgi:hypothetical protein
VAHFLVEKNRAVAETAPFKKRKDYKKESIT